MEQARPARSRMKVRTSAVAQDWSTTRARSGKPLVVSAPLQDEVDSLLREKLDLHSQLFEAAQIQRKLSGPRALHRGTVEFATETFAAHYLTGDFAVLSPHGLTVLAALGDIAGKGFSAGMWFTNLIGLLQSYGRPGSDPAKIAWEINQHLCYLRPVAPLVTAFLAQIDCARGAVTYCNAGHFPPILLRADGCTEQLDIGGPLLGAVEGAEFQAAAVTLEPGDTLVAYSDGVLECCNKDGEEFGSSRLLGILQETKQSSAQAILLSLLAAVQDFANGSPLRDDVSLTVIQRDSNISSG